MPMFSVFPTSSLTSSKFMPDSVEMISWTQGLPSYANEPGSMNLFNSVYSFSILSRAG